MDRTQELSEINNSAYADAPLSDDERSFLQYFAIFIIIIAFPGKALFYISPGFIIIISMFIGHFINFWRLIGIALTISILSIFTMLLDAFAGIHANWAGLLVGMITYLPMLILWSTSKSFHVSANLVWRCGIVCATFVSIQAAIGVVQFLLSHNGDLVSGTFGLFDVSSETVTISQVNYCFTMFCSIVFCAIWLRRITMVFTCVGGLLAVLIAEAAHQTIFFLALLPALAITGGHAGKRLTISALGGGALLAVALIVDPGLYTHGQGWVNKVLFSERSPKRLAVLGAITMMTDPKNLLMGVGVGQFSSRAAIFTSGFGTTVKLPSEFIDTSTYYDMYMHHPIEIFNAKGEGSAMAMPYFSALSFTTEFGLIFTIVSVSLLFHAVIINIKLGRINDEARKLSYYCNFFLGFLLCCCFIQNYLELIQAIAIPIMLYLIAKARLRTLNCRDIA